MSKLLVLVTLASLSWVAHGQSCGFQGINGTTITFAPLNETTPGGFLIARLQLVNVESTAAISHPHYNYIVALRYPNGTYDLKTADIFPQFIRAQRTDTVERPINLRCDDGSASRFNLFFPVIDINDPPTFNDVDSVTVQLPVNRTVVTGIVVTDPDLDFEASANVYITSSNRNFAPVVTPLFNLSQGVPSEYSYQVDFQVDPNVTEGEYQTILTADDETNSLTKTIRITVLAPITPSTPETPETEGTFPVTNGTTTVPPTTTEELPETEVTLPPGNSTLLRILRLV